MAHLRSFTAICLLMATVQISAGRELLQSCLSKASTTVGGACQDFVALQSSLPPGNATDAQLQAVLAKNDKPSPSCCSEVGDLVTSHCQCDATVREYSGFYDLTPDNLVTFARMAKLACGPTYIANSTNPFCNGTAPMPGR